MYADDIRYYFLFHLGECILVSATFCESCFGGRAIRLTWGRES